MAEVICLIGILIGYWLGRGAPLPKRNKQESEPKKELTEDEIQFREKQIELQKQLDTMLNYSGVVRRENANT